MASTSRRTWRTGTRPAARSAPRRSSEWHPTTGPAGSRPTLWSGSYTIIRFNRLVEMRLRWRATPPLDRSRPAFGAARAARRGRSRRSEAARRRRPRPAPRAARPARSAPRPLRPRRPDQEPIRDEAAGDRGRTLTPCSTDRSGPCPRRGRAGRLRSLLGGGAVAPRTTQGDRDPARPRLAGRRSSRRGPAGQPFVRYFRTMRRSNTPPTRRSVIGGSTEGGRPRARARPPVVAAPNEGRQRTSSLHPPP